VAQELPRTQPFVNFTRGCWLGNRLVELEDAVGKYVLAWLFGVPLSVLAVIYVVSHAACGQ
jgi:hypothetical protein